VRPKTIVYFEWIIFGTLLLRVFQNFSAVLLGSLPSGWFRAIAYRAIELGAPADQNLGAAILIFLTFIDVLVGTLTLLVSRRRSSIAMGVSLMIFVFGLLVLIPTINRGEALQSIGQVVAYGLLFTPSARRWMNRKDEKAA
jgi:hypothetical protein